MTARHLMIDGKVQGVYFRDSAVAKALELGVNGWVRNCSDGKVEALVAGDDEGVEAFVSWAWEGPPAARVDHVEIEEIELEVEPPGFVRLPSKL
jgi:acylphosphatase